MKKIIQDPLFRVKVLAKTENPQSLCWSAAHQDYSEKYVGEEDLPPNEIMSETTSGNSLVKHCVQFGHWGVLEHPSITFAVGYFPHSVMVQARTHRSGVSFDCQSMRYTSERFIEYYRKWEIGQASSSELESLFYLRPVGTYSDRQGGSYDYTPGKRRLDLDACEDSLAAYSKAVLSGCPEEQARDLLASGYRQHFVVSFNMRSLLHFLDLRSKADAQPEIQALCELLFEELKVWSPEVARHYEEKRLHKARLSP